MLLGCIGDDFTGSSDLANTLAKAGMAVVQYNGVPDGPAAAHVEAGIVALKTRTVPADDAVRQSLRALDWLRAQGCRQFLFKYCSTFDSTPQGNIGPVLDALCAALDAPRAIVCPAFPATGRSIYQGHLFVGDRLLSESGMERHPLTPMTDPDLRRWLAHQTAERIGHVPLGTIQAGPDAIRAALDALTGEGVRYVVTDAVGDADLHAIGRAAVDDILLSGGSGIAIGLPGNFRAKGLIGDRVTRWTGVSGPVAALCGSCSRTSQRQIAAHRTRHPTREADPAAIIEGRLAPQDFADWMLSSQSVMAVPLVHSSSDPAVVAEMQARYGRERAADAIERFFADLARLLGERGVRRLITAGGETSGAVVSGLSIASFEIGPEIDPGVPALLHAGSGMALALKSGNFGGADFFEKAARVLASTLGPETAP